MAVNLAAEHVVRLLIARGADPFLDCTVTTKKDGRIVRMSPYARVKEMKQEQCTSSYSREENLNQIKKFIEENHWPIEKRLEFLRIFQPRANQDLPSRMRVPREVVCYGLYKAISHSHLIQGRPP
jgi:hypothetical protein